MFAQDQAKKTKISIQPVQVILPVLAGCAMLVASFLPWLNDPTGIDYSAWQLPIDIGWQVSSSILNYGLLCTGAALIAFWIALDYWRTQDFPPRFFSGPFLSRLFPVKSGSQERSLREETIQRLARWQLCAGLLCLVPVLLFLLQYLCINMKSIDMLAQHKLQLLLIQQHLGYKLAERPILILPFQLDITTLQGRLILLIDQSTIGLFAPFLSAWLLLAYLPTLNFGLDRTRHLTARQFIGVAIGVVILVLLLRGPLATLSEYRAKTLLAQGDYAAANGWLDNARTLNPELALIPSYHEERGQVWYFLHPGNPNDDSHLYLSSIYRTQGDYLDAYQELLLAWRADHSTSWVKDEMGLTVALMSENVPQKIKGSSLLSSDLEVSALTWLQILSRVDHSNLYSLYYMGRIEYDKHDFETCIKQMQMLLKLSKNTDIRSSAYTYIALSLRGEGRINEARRTLLQALNLDPYYHNNTAREEMSGLH